MAIKDAVRDLRSQSTRPFGMWVLSLRDGVSVSEAVEILSKNTEDDAAAISSINSTSQIVISGYTDSLSRIFESMRTAGILRHHRLLQHVTAPFHSLLLARAAERFGAEVSQRITLLRPPKGPISTIISNLDARPAYHLDVSNITLSERLSAHITKTVLWQQSIDWCLINEEIGEFWQMGPGSVLYDLLRRDQQSNLRINAHCFSTL